MKRSILIGLVAIAFAFAAAGTARADVPPLPSGTGWCGQAADTCDTSTTYVECSDGWVWVLEPEWDTADFGDIMCDGDYAVLVAPTSLVLLDDSSSGVDVGLGADPNMAPDPTLYGTEVRCPDGSIWAVPIGDDFVCPAA